MKVLYLIVAFLLCILGVICLSFFRNHYSDSDVLSKIKKNLSESAWALDSMQLYLKNEKALKPPFTRVHLSFRDGWDSLSVVISDGVTRQNDKNMKREVPAFCTSLMFGDSHSVKATYYQDTAIVLGTPYVTYSLLAADLIYPLHYEDYIKNLSKSYTLLDSGQGRSDKRKLFMPIANGWIVVFNHL